MGWSHRAAHIDVRFEGKESGRQLRQCHLALIEVTEEMIVLTEWCERVWEAANELVHDGLVVADPSSVHNVPTGVFNSVDVAVCNLEARNVGSLKLVLREFHSKYVGQLVLSLEKNPGFDRILV